jgi:hypothetical protein
VRLKRDISNRKIAATPRALKALIGARSPG